MPVFGYEVEEGRFLGIRVVYMDNNQIGMSKPFRDAFELNAETWFFDDGAVDHYIRFEASSYALTKAIDIESLSLEVDGARVRLEPASERETESRFLGSERESRLFRASASILRRIAAAGEVTAIVDGAKDITRDFDDENLSRFRQWTERFVDRQDVVGERTVVVRAERANVRERPSTDALVLATLERGAEITTEGKQGEWFVVDMEEIDEDLSGVGYLHESTVTVRAD